MSSATGFQKPNLPGKLFFFIFRNILSSCSLLLELNNPSIASYISGRWVDCTKQKSHNYLDFIQHTNNGIQEHLHTTIFHKQQQSLGNFAGNQFSFQKIVYHSSSMAARKHLPRFRSIHEAFISDGNPQHVLGSIFSQYN